MSEDPVLAGKMSAGLIRGIQSQGIPATLKHFACKLIESLVDMGGLSEEEKNKNIMRKELCFLEENLTDILRLDIPSIQEGFNISKPAHTK